MHHIPRYFCFVLFVLFVVVSACGDKRTIVTGLIRDQHTGEPIDSATVTFQIVLKKEAFEPGALDYEDLRSDENGNFVYSYGHGKSIGFYTVSKIGYLYKGQGFPKINRGETNEVTVNLIPKDGLLKLLVNNTGPTDTIYLGVYSPLQDEEHGLSLGLVHRDTFFMAGLTELSSVLRLASEQTVDIHWSRVPLPYDYRKIPSQGSVLIPRNDTATFHIVL